MLLPLPEMSRLRCAEFSSTNGEIAWGKKWPDFIDLLSARPQQPCVSRIDITHEKMKAPVITCICANCYHMGKQGVAGNRIHLCCFFGAQGQIVV